MSQIPPEFSMLMELVENMTPTLEEELSMEKEIRQLQASDDIERIKLYTEALTRQNHEQSRFIAGCLQEIHVLKAKLACATPVKKKLD
mgnify:FL=1